MRKKTKTIRHPSPNRHGFYQRPTWVWPAHDYHGTVKVSLIVSLGFRLTQAAYYLSLGLWLGGMVMVGLVAGYAFPFTRSLNLSLDPTVVAEGDERAANYVAGSIVNNSLETLGLVGIVVLLIAMMAVAIQSMFFVDRMNRSALANINVIRILVLLLLAALLLYDQISLGPTLREHLEMMYDPLMPLEDRLTHEAAFDTLHKRSRLAHTGMLIGLLAAIGLAPFCFRLPSKAQTPVPETNKAS